MGSNRRCLIGELCQQISGDVEPVVASLASEIGDPVESGIDKLTAV